jgi:acyl dehydratase
LEKSWPAVDYEVGREKIREFVEATEERHAIHRDADAAREAGFRDLVAPPMFAVVYTHRSLWPAIEDPEVGIDLSKMLHVGQDFRWDEPVCAGDVISTETSLAHVQKGRKRSTYTFESQARNDRGEDTVHATWTMMVMGG